VRKTQLGTSKKLNPRYQGPFRVSKVFPNHTVEIRTYNGNGTQLTHVNRLKALTECMVWRDEECVDFDDFRSSQLKNTGPTEEASEENRDSDENDEEDKFNPPDMEDEEPLINLDSIVLQDAEENLIDFNSPAPLRPATTVDKEPSTVNPDGGQGQPPEEILTLPPPLTPSQATMPTVGKQVVNEEARPRRATRLPDRYRNFLLD
jgi:hypothetical protein